MEPLPIRCNCGHMDHQLEMADLFEPDDPSWSQICAIEIHLYPHRLGRRIIGAVKYIFGFRSRYGDFDELLLDEITATELRDWLSDWLQQIRGE